MHKLREIRLSKGMPIAAVAVRARVGTGTIVMIERHGHTPRIDTQFKIARAIGVSAETIFGPSDHSDPLTAA